MCIWVVARNFTDKNYHNYGDCINENREKTGKQYAKYEAKLHEDIVGW